MGRNRSRPNTIYVSLWIYQHYNIYYLTDGSLNADSFDSCWFFTWQYDPKWWLVCRFRGTTFPEKPIDRNVFCLYNRFKHRLFPPYVGWTSPTDERMISCYRIVRLRCYIIRVVCDIMRWSEYIRIIWDAKLMLQGIVLKILYTVYIYIIIMYIYIHTVYIYIYWWFFNAFKPFL